VVQALYPDTSRVIIPVLTHIRLSLSIDSNRSVSLRILLQDKCYPNSDPHCEIFGKDRLGELDAITRRCLDMSNEAEAIYTEKWLVGIIEKVLLKL
jgi:hypothetical protein